MGAQAAIRGEETHGLPTVKALAGVLCGLAGTADGGEISSLMRNVEEQIKDSPFIKTPSN